MLTDTLDDAAYEHADSDVAIGSTYQYRLQAQSAAGYGPRTAALGVTVTPPPPPDPAYFGAAQTAATTLDLAWDAVAEATGYHVEIRQSFYASSHAEAYVRLPDSGTFTLQTGATTTATVTVTGTGTARRLTGLPAGYTSWSLDVRAVNAGGTSNWVSAYVHNDPANPAPAPPTGLTGSALRGRHGRPSAGRAVTGADRVPGPFPVPGRQPGRGRLGLAVHARGDGHRDRHHGHGRGVARGRRRLGVPGQCPQRRLRRIPGLGPDYGRQHELTAVPRTAPPDRPRRRRPVRGTPSPVPLAPGSLPCFCSCFHLHGVD